jgi:hypothetical protein
VTSTLVDGLTAPWTDDGSGLWTLSASPRASYGGPDGVGMRIVAAAGSHGAPAPFAERQFTPARDLREAEELRLWLKSSRPGDGTPARPFYLAFEATTDPPAAGTPWRRLLPVSRPGTWELHRLWLGDMPSGLRQAVGFLRLRSLDASVAFRGALDDVVATAPEPIQDVEAALFERLHNTFQVTVAGTPTNVPAILDVPESPGTRTEPYILITPWSLLPLGRRAGSEDLVDNYTETGAFVRPAPWAVQLEYRIDVFGDERPQKTYLLERVVEDIARDPLLVDAVRLDLVPFQPSREEMADLVIPGRTPLFYRVVTQFESGPRVFSGQAVPYLVTGPREEDLLVETVSV